MEITFMNQVARAANLRPILRHAALQKAMEEVIEGYIKIVNEDPRGTRNRDTLSLREITGGIGVPFKPSVATQPGQDVFEALLQRFNYHIPPGMPSYIDENIRERQSGSLFLHRKITPCQFVKIGGVKFEPGQQSLKNSNVMYSDFQDRQQVYAGRIKQIFLHKRPVSEHEYMEETFLAIERLIPLNEIDRSHDHFSRYPKVGGSLYYEEYQAIVDIVSPVEVLCHFSRTPYTSPSISRECVHVLPLDRVGTSIFSRHSGI